MKYYCRQVEPHLQQSRIFVNRFGRTRTDETLFNNSIMLMPQRDRHPFMSDFLKYIHDTLEPLLEEIDGYVSDIEKDRIRECWESEKENGIRQILSCYAFYKRRLSEDGEYVPSVDWTSEEIGKWQETWFVHGQLKGLDEKLAYALTLITGNEWKIRQIHGSVQGDWAESLYDSSVVSEEDLRIFECEYFNLGTEWMVPERYQCDPEDEAPTVCVYCHTSDPEQARLEIAQYIGCDASDVILGIPERTITYNYI